MNEHEMNSAENLFAIEVERVGMLQSIESGEISMSVIHDHPESNSMFDASTKICARFWSVYARRKNGEAVYLFDGEDRADAIKRARVQATANDVPLVLGLGVDGAA